MKKHINDRLRDKDWNEAIKKSFEECNFSVPKRMEALEREFSEAPVNIKKTDCNIKLSAIAGCLSVQSFLVIFMKSLLFNKF